LIIKISAHAASPLSRRRQILAIILRSEIIRRAYLGYWTGSDVGGTSLRARISKTINIFAQERLGTSAHGAF